MTGAFWSGVYDSELADIRAVQSDVARNVAREIRSNTAGPTQTANSPSRARNVNPEAYTTFLKGNYFLHQGIPGSGLTDPPAGATVRISSEPSSPML